MPFINSITYRQLATLFFTKWSKKIVSMEGKKKKKVQMDAFYHIVDFEIEVKFDDCDLILIGWLELTIF